MYCPFNICCCRQLIASWFDLIGWYSAWLRLSLVAKPSGIIILHCSLTQDWKLCIMPKDSLRLLYIYLWTDIHDLLLTIRPWYISNWNSRSSYIKLVNHWHILSYFCFPPLFLRVSTALTVTNTFSACLFDFRVGRTNPGTFGAALTSCCSGHSGSSMPLLGPISDSSSAAQSCSLSFALSKSPFQFSQSSVSEMLWGALSSSHSTGWWLILRIWRTFKIWVRPPGRFFADKAGGKGDLSDNLNAAAPSCWKSDQDALMHSSVSEMYPTAVICLFWARDSFWVAHRFWLPCHISKKLWTLAILCNFLSSASFFISESFSVCGLSNSRSVPAKIPLLPQAICLTTTFLRRVSPVVFDCLHRITSRPTEKPASTPTPCGMTENMSRSTLERSAYFECVSFCWRYQSVMSSIQNVLLISIGSEW